MFHLRYNGVLSGGQITSAWSAPGGNRATGIPISDLMTMTLTLSGLTATVVIDGVTVYTTTLTNAPTGTYAGAHVARTHWNAAVGYRDLTVQENAA